MLSLKKFMSSAEDREALLHVSSLILDGMVLHTIAHDPEEFGRFQDTIRHLQQQLVEGGQDNRSLPVMAGAIIQTFQLYNRSVHRQFTAESNELRNLVKLLTDVLRDSCHSNERIASTLGEIEQELRVASQAEDIRSLKVRLQTCLASVHTEIERQVAERDTTRTTLDTVTATANLKLSVVASGTHPITGLPERSEAHVYLEKVRAFQAAYYAIVFSLDRSSIVKSRFGSRAADGHLLAASQTIAQSLEVGDQLFQLNSQAFVAVVERSGSLAGVQSEFGRLGDARRNEEYTLSIGQRAVSIPISISSLCLPVWEAPNTDSLMERVDSFVLKVAA